MKTRTTSLFLVVISTVFLFSIFIVIDCYLSDCDIFNKDDFEIKSENLAENSQNEMVLLLLYKYRERKKMCNRLCVFSFILILIVIAYNSYHYARNKKLSNTIVKQEREILRSVEQKNKLRKSICEYLDNLSKKPLSDSWHLIQEAINKAYDNFIARLKIQYPHLRNEDLLLCSLVKIGMDTSDIAVRMNISKEYVRKKKSRLRASLEITDRKLNLNVFLQNF